ncbi:hypothetical protein [Nocardia niwae]|uniref:hypothetical protein n=1 Tax=Nocardia niwae TaxID=626084 RepID=UPI0033DC3543
MKRRTDLLCTSTPGCLAPLDEIDDDHGTALVCGDCGQQERIGEPASICQLAERRGRRAS